MAVKSTKMGVGHFLFGYSEIVTHACGRERRDVKENPLPLEKERRKSGKSVES